jgi:hypothetical protein
LVAFVAYYGVACFKIPWAGDLYRYAAGVSALQISLWDPAHESIAASPQDGVGRTSTIIYTPYLVAVGALARVLDVSAYRALQVAGLLNLVFFVLALLAFLRTFGRSRSPALAAAFFVAVMLVLRAEEVGWSSETSASTMTQIQAYPSVFAWGLALALFVWAEGFLARGHVGRLAAVVVGQTLLLLSHTLTGSWVFGILGLRGLWLLRPAADGTLRARARRVGALFVGQGIAVGLCLAWPWSSFLRLFGFLGHAEVFPATPISTFWPLWAVALPCCLWCAWRGVHRFWLLALVASSCVYLLAHGLSVDFLARYVFFAAFCGQLVLADCMALALETWWSTSTAAPPPTRLRPRERWALSAVAMAALALMTWPGWPATSSRLLPPGQLWQAPSSHQTFYAAYGPLRDVLGPKDVAMMPLSGHNWALAATTGARLVATPLMHLIADHQRRQDDVRRFYATSTAPQERLAIARRHGVTKVLVRYPMWWQWRQHERRGSARADRQAEAASAQDGPRSTADLFGAPVARHRSWLVFAIHSRLGP